MLRYKKPLLLTADAYNTLYAPLESIPKQYNRLTQPFNVSLPPEVLSKRYMNSYRTRFSQMPNYGKYEGIKVTEFWSTVLRDVYGEFESQIGKQNLEKMIETVVAAFQRKNQYRVFEDFIRMADWTKKNGIPLCIASNADAGVTRLIVDEFDMAQYIEPDNVYLSYDLDVTKPDPKFFEMIIDDQLSRRGIDSTDGSYEEAKKELLARTWHVGDEHEKDGECAVKAGLGAIVVDRSSDITTPEVEGDRLVVIPSLDLVETLFYH